MGCGPAGGAMGGNNPPAMTETEKIINSVVAAAGLSGIAAAIGKGGPKPPSTLNPGETPVYRGGTDVTVRPGEIRTTSTGLVKTSHGISLSTNPSALQKFGGANQVKSVPPGLQIIQRGSNASHFEVVPVGPITLERYQGLLNRIEFH